jgi:hypothetical protein
MEKMKQKFASTFAVVLIYAVALFVISSGDIDGIKPSPSPTFSPTSTPT